MALRLGCLLLFAAVAPVVAQPAPAPEPAPPPPTEPPAPVDEVIIDDDFATKAEALAARVQELEHKLATMEQLRKARLPVKFTGYGDFGLFAVQGDGSGFRRDAGHTVFPDRSAFGWVFYGDLLATQINSRGDVADLGDAPGVERFDSVHSRGNLTFLVNELNLGVSAGLSERALFQSSVNFTPRTSGTEFALGDSFDVDLAQVEWMPTRDGKTSLFVGKVDSVLGIEYRTRKANQRFGITPSLVARYTTGTAVGVKARTKLLNDHLIVAAAVTNGSFGTEQFHFFREVDTNNFKTLSGRIAFKTTWGGDGGLEIGPSGQWGVQDGADDDGGGEWFVGVDLAVDVGPAAVKAQWLKGKAPGQESTATYGLDLKQGGYIEANVIATPLIGVLARAEFRDAEVHQGTERLYITKNWRTTVGVRFLFTPNAVIKAEYSHNGEYGGTPKIPDDVVTTSAVMGF